MRYRRFSIQPSMQAEDRVESKVNSTFQSYVALYPQNILRIENPLHSFAKGKKGERMEKKMYGYVRVSSRDQNVARQLIAMSEFGVEEKNIIIEKQSGKDFERPQYIKLMKKLRTGDILVIKSIDRLGRNYNEILEQWRTITKEKKVGIVVLDMPLLDTRAGRDLTSTLISDIVLQLLSYIAQTERDFIRQRQKEGIAAAKARGVRFGKRAIEIPEQFPSVYQLWISGQTASRQAAKMLGVSQNTFLKWAHARLNKNT